jgi:hypothetical protein
MTVRGTQDGTFVAAATLAAGNDADSQNNAVNVSLTVGGQTPPPSPGTGDDGGGGGSLGWTALLGLLLAGWRRLAPLTPTLSPQGRGGKTSSPSPARGRGLG